MNEISILQTLDKTFNDQSCNAGEKLKNQVYIWIQNFCWKLISPSHCGTNVPTFDASFIIKATVVEILQTVSKSCRSFQASSEILTLVGHNILGIH